MKLLNLFLICMLACVTLPVIADTDDEEYSRYSRENYRTQEYLPPSERENYRRRSDRNDYREEEGNYDYPPYRKYDDREKRHTPRMMEEGSHQENSEHLSRERTSRQSQSKTFDPIAYTCKQFRKDFEKKNFITMIAAIWGNGYAAKKFGYQDAPPLDKPSLIISASFFIDLCEKTKSNLFVEMLEAWEETSEKPKLEEQTPEKSESAQQNSDANIQKSE